SVQSLFAGLRVQASALFQAISGSGGCFFPCGSDFSASHSPCACDSDSSPPTSASRLLRTACRPGSKPECRPKLPAVCLGNKKGPHTTCTVPKPPGVFNSSL